LNIPFVELDLEDAYKTGVADYMIAEYTAGRTPNPDVMCNKMVKFGGFLDWALSHGADYIATGHYAQNKHNHLIQGNDQSKDQSYFLWTLTQEQLSHTLFPIGHLPKSTVRKLAKKYNLPTAVKKDSQGICFIGEIDMKQFLEHYITPKPGNVITVDDKIIGHHNGALFYTLGERHGFVITDKGTHDKPYYVIAKDLVHNTITVSQDPQSEAIRTSLYTLVDTYFRKLDTQKMYTAQIRYHGAYKQCSIINNGEQYTVQFSDTDYSIASGQSVVFYDGDICIGGGIIK
jgi:tRNA-specific 2-thiouridylase